MPESHRAIGPEGVAVGPITAHALPGAIGLRDVAVNGEILLRGLQFVVRDRHWGTHALTARQTLRQTANEVALICAGTLECPDGDLTWEAVFLLTAAGIEARCHAHSAGGFETSRTGLIVLHDVPACRGQPATLRHSGGETTLSRFPTLVAPNQPFRDLTGLSYSTAAGHGAAFIFTGEIFETEDQRNWTDGSFKTYSRKLDLPYPYRIAPATPVAQQVQIEVTAGQTSRGVSLLPQTRRVAPFPALVAPPRGEPGPFASFNRGEPRTGAFDWSMSPTVHAADDDTIGETVEPLADLIATAKQREPTRSFHIGPLRLETRFGDVPPPPDPRRGGLIEAAWVLGTIAGLLDPAVAALAFDTPAGAASHLLARLAPFQGREAGAIDWPGLRRVKGLILRRDRETLLLVAHLSHATAPLHLPPGKWHRPEWLDATGFVPAPRPERLEGFTVLCFAEGS